RRWSASWPKTHGRAPREAHMKLATEFVKLPWRFDAGRLAAELAQFEGEPWMDHPDRTEGNSALALISRDGGDNNNFRGEMKPTPHLARCP
ncbi:MAG: hypothetical protein ACKO4A_14220, partial [Gammaproteobacteria bacterium]